MSDDSTYYSILNIPPDSNSDDIKKAYRKLSMRYHPDKNNNTTNDIFKKITEAYAVLSSSENNNVHKKSHVITCQNNAAERIPSNGEITAPQNITINQELSLKQAYFGANLPITIDRTIHINNMVNSEQETIYVKFPEGIDNGEIITLPNKGNMRDLICSELKIIIELNFSERFSRSGLDLVFNKTVSFKESLTGFEFILNHINGKSYKIQNYSGEIINNNSHKIIESFGFKRDGYVGNLIIKFNVEYPTKLSNDIIEKLKVIL